MNHSLIDIANRIRSELDRENGHSWLSYSGEVHSHNNEIPFWIVLDAKPFAIERAISAVKSIMTHFESDTKNVNVTFGFYLAFPNDFIEALDFGPDAIMI